MNTVRTNAFVFAICDEHEKAERKHPRFADRMMGPGEALIATKCAENAKRANDNKRPGDVTAKDVFQEEFLEAMAEYAKGDHDACLDELAQCGAVILRMMDFVADERDGNEGKRPMPIEDHDVKPARILESTHARRQSGRHDGTK